MPNRTPQVRPPQAVPAEFAGRWIVWNADHSRIVAHADTLQRLWQLARDQRIDDPVFERVPRTDVRFVGTT